MHWNILSLMTRMALDWCPSSLLDATLCVPFRPISGTFVRLELLPHTSPLPTLASMNSGSVNTMIPIPLPPHLQLFLVLVLLLGLLLLMIFAKESSGRRATILIFVRRSNGMDGGALHLPLLVLMGVKMCLTALTSPPQLKKGICSMKAEIHLLCF